MILKFLAKSLAFLRISIWGVYLKMIPQIPFVFNGTHTSQNIDDSNIKVAILTRCPGAGN